MKTTYAEVVKIQDKFIVKVMEKTVTRILFFKREKLKFRYAFSATVSNPTKWNELDELFRYCLFDSEDQAKVIAELYNKMQQVTQ